MRLRITLECAEMSCKIGFHSNVGYLLDGFIHRTLAGAQATLLTS